MPRTAIRFVLLIVALATLWPLSAQAVTIDWVTVGNPGNAGELSGAGAGGFGTDAIVGGVGYTYQISKYEVTNSQYTEFLNAKAATDTFSLYSTSMDTSALGGITRSGTSGSYTYAVKSGRGNNPVAFVSFYDSLRFANWLHNGQGSGNTETGTYTLLGGTPTPSNGTTVTRNPGAQVFLTSEDEWYKAAYHRNDGVTGNYWDYPTSTDATPYSDQPPGSDAPTQSNTANFNQNDSTANGYNDGWAVTGSTSFVSSTNYLSDVGAYTFSKSPYNTFDQGANLWEWNEAIMGSDRGLRGGSWDHNNITYLAASGRNGFPPALERNYVGFRVASPFTEAASVPEPGTLVLAVLGMFFLGVHAIRRNRA